MTKIKGFSIQFIPGVDIERLDSGRRIKKLLDTILNDKIIILQGKLHAEEEARLIEDTMAMVGHVKGFKGVELAVIEPSKEGVPFMSQIRHGIANLLVRNQDALTIIGPASIIKEIKKDPKKIELMFKR
jgi:hypothetical protein